MKVLNLILDARLGGPQLRITEVGKYLFEYGVETVAIFPDKDSADFRTLLKQDNIRHISTGLHKLSRNPIEFFKWFIFFLPETMKLIRIFKRENPTIIHCNGAWQWKGIIASKFAHIKAIWHLNDTHMPLFIKIGFKYLNQWADGFIVAGTRVKQYYLDSFDLKKTIVIIQAPVDTEKFNPGKRIEPDKGIAVKQGIKIVTVANLNRAKGLEYLIDAAGILNKKYDDLNFFVIGEAFSTQKKYAAKLSKLVEKYRLENFFFYGSSSTIPAILKSADIFVCPSKTEASPQSVWEAMAMEKAIVSTDVGSVPDFITDGVNGFIVPVKNPQKMAEKIDLLINNPGLRYQFGKKARQVAQKELDVKIAAQKHKEIYERIANLK